MKRLLGLDLFRTVALFGMLVAHVGPAAWTAGTGFGSVDWGVELFHSRMPAMFAFAAGLSLNLGGGSRGGARGGGPTPEVPATLIRAALLTLIGLGLAALGTPVAVILAYFGLWFVLVLPFRRLRPRGLFIAAGVWAIAGPALSFWLRTLPAIDALPGAGLVRGSALWHGMVSGDYPALTWMPFMLAGLGVGRLDLTQRAVRRALGWTGAALTVAAYGLSGWFLAAGGADAIMRTLTPSGSRSNVTQEFAHLLFRERGVTDEGTWLWLFAPGSHSGSWADVVGCLGVCLLLLALLLPLGDWAARAGSVGAASVRMLAVPGSMVLSLYAIHIAAMALITWATGHSFSGAQSVWMLTGFCVGLLGFAVLWSLRSPRGPVETVLGRASSAIERTGRRVFGGSSRQ